jgi:hypothetical protein
MIAAINTPPVTITERFLVVKNLTFTTFWPLVEWSLAPPLGAVKK